MVPIDLIGFQTFTLGGAPLARAVAALKVAREQVKLAFADTESWRVEAVLSEIEDQIGVQLAEIADAVEQDSAEREESGEAAALRQAWLPLGAA